MPRRIRSYAARALGEQPAPLQWLALLLTSSIFVVPLELSHFPAGMLLGSMVAGVVVTAGGANLLLRRWLYVIAQGIVGCLMARSIGPGILEMLISRWPLFIVTVGVVLVFSSAIGGLLARWRVLPGTTAVWGSAPGAATAMVLMSGAFGGDMRLVAFMQFLRVILVALLASVVSRLWAKAGAVPTFVWFPALPAGPLWGTLILALGGAFLGVKLRIPVGALLVPLVAGATLSGVHLLTITLPPVLLAACYVFVGWAFGLGFSRETVLHAARVLPSVAGSIVVLIALCAALAYGLHCFAGIDPLTAYLATSPGGADSVAIIAASSKVDVPFVMAMQTARLVLVLLIGPGLARLVSRWAAPRETATD